MSSISRYCISNISNACRYYPVDLKYVALYASSELQSQTNEDNSTTPDDNLNAPSHNDKTKAIVTQARTRANKAREKCLADGEEDKVEYALQVARHQKPGAEGKAGKTSSNSQFNASSSSKDVNTTSNKKRVRAGSEEDKDGDEAKEPGAVGTPSNKQQLKPTTPSSKTVISASTTHQAEEKDSFFVEEASASDFTALLPIATIPHRQNRQQQSQAGQQRSAKGNKYANQNKKAYLEVKQAVNKRKFANHQSIRQLKGEQFGSNFSHAVEGKRQQQQQARQQNKRRKF